MEHIGLVGLPNSGKTSLFNALTGRSAPVAPHPFTTTETSVGIAVLPDHRLDALAEMSKSRKVVRAGVEMVDIAGLVAGSSTGEGLGNRFLGGIREVDALLLVVRAFEDPEVPGDPDPLASLQTLELELVLADVASVESQIDRKRKAARADRRASWRRSEAMEARSEVLEQGHPALPVDRQLDQQRRAEALRRGQFFLTDKPVLAVVNIGEDQLDRGRRLDKACRRRARRARRGARRVRPARSRGSSALRRRARRDVRRPRTRRRRTCPGCALGVPPARSADVPHHRGQGVAGLELPRRSRPRLSAQG